MVSCNKDFVVAENHGSKIEFRTAVDTRATELTLSDVNEFYVAAFYESGEQYFAEVFERSGSFFVPKSGTDYYWPSDDDLYFYAYYPCTEAFSAGVMVDEENKSIPDYTPAANIGEQLDFISAVKVTNKAESANGVVLEFKHQLSQIEVKAKNANGGYNVKVKAVRIKNVVDSGDFTFDGAMTNWRVNDTLTSYEAVCDATNGSVALTGSAATLMGANGNAMLIPQSRSAWGVEAEAANGVYIALQIQAETKTGSRVFPLEGDWGWVAVPVEINWASGYKYTYVCDFTNGLGVIAPDQDEEGDDDDNPYNPGDGVVGGAIAVDTYYDSFNGNWDDLDM